jgi:DNA repair exonuclease SbcCD ATPase subunit
LALATATALGLFELTSLSASAQSTRVEQISAQIALARDQESKAIALLNRMNELASQNEARKKEYDAAQTELQALQPRIDRYTQALTRYEADLRAYEAQVKDYNGRCGGTLAEDKYRTCLKEKGDLAARQIELDRAREGIAAEREKVQAEWRAVVDRQSAISKTMARNVEGWEAAQAEYGTIYRRVEGVRRQLVELCAAGDAARDPDSVRICVSLGWDAARRQFGALVDLPAPQPAK